MRDEGFVGRQEELAQFAALLEQLRASRPGWVGGRYSRRRHTNLAEISKSRVVLVCGLAGCGKSSLLKQFEAMAQEGIRDSRASANRVRTALLDWGDEQAYSYVTYRDVVMPPLVAVLDAIKRALINSFADDRKAKDWASRAFRSYRQGAARMPEYAARFADLGVESGRPGSVFTNVDATALLQVMASMGLTAAGHPAGIVGLSPEQIARAASAGGRLSEAAFRAVAGKKPGEVSEQEYSLVTDPVRELTQRLAVAIRTTARKTPLLILMDTGEIVGEQGWRWLRRTMNLAGPRVAWAIAGRFQAEAGAGSSVAQFSQEIGSEHLLLMSPGQFDDATIQAYLLKRRPSAPRYTDAQIGLIAQFTKGLPLAVSLTATLLDQGQLVENACRSIDHGQPSNVVSELAHRYLVHAERQTCSADDSLRGDVMRILSLALICEGLHEDIFEGLLAVMWQVEYPLGALQELAHRHDFVLPVSRRLHRDVKATLLTELLDPWQRRRIRQVNERAHSYLTSRLEYLCRRRPTLDEQIGRMEFARILLAVLWHTFWRDNQSGLDTLAQILPVLALADPPTADMAMAMTETFVGSFTDDQRHDLTQIAAGRAPMLFDQPLPFDDKWVARRCGAAYLLARRTGITVPSGAVQSPSGEVGCLLIGEPRDWEAAVDILRAWDLAQARDFPSAVAALRAATQTRSKRLRKAIGSLAQQIGSRLIWAGPGNTAVSSDTGLAAAELASEMLPGNTWSWCSYAAALSYAGRLSEALVAYDKAVEVDPANARAYNGRGVVLRRLGSPKEALGAYDQALAINARYAYAHDNRAVAMLALGQVEEALTACDQAIDIAPDNGSAHENKGIALAIMGDFDRALSEFDTAEKLMPTAAGEAMAWAGAILWHLREAAAARRRFACVKGRTVGCTPFRAAELEAIALCMLGRPGDAEQHLLTAKPLQTPGDRAEPQTIYHMLSKPPLLGIDRLHSITVSDS